MAVITEEESYYTFNIKYVDEPEKLNIEMKDFMHDGIATNKPNNSGKETDLWAILENIFYPPDNPQIYFCIMHFSSFSMLLG